MGGMLLSLLLPSVCSQSVTIFTSPIAVPLSQGLSKLDSVCNDVTPGAIALVCTGNRSVASMFNENSSVYNAHGNLLASAGNVAQGLFQGILSVSIPILPPGGAGFLATGCDQNGQAKTGATCDDWTNAGSKTTYGAPTTLGLNPFWISTVGAGFVNLLLPSCKTNQRIYCALIQPLATLPLFPPTPVSPPTPSDGTVSSEALSGCQSSQLYSSLTTLLTGVCDVAVSIPPIVTSTTNILTTSLQNKTLFPLVDDLVSDVLTIDFHDVQTGQETSVSGLSTPVMFYLPLDEKGAASLNEVKRFCQGNALIKGPVLPECYWYDTNNTVWTTSGCERVGINETHIQCACNHLTSFAALLPKSNTLQNEQFRAMTPENIQAHPAGIITLCVVYCLFAMALCYATRLDTQDERERDLRKAKWTSQFNLGKDPKFSKKFKVAMQTKHTLFAIFFRRLGSSLRSTARCCVTLVLVMVCICISAAFYAQNQTWYGQGQIIIFTSVASLIPTQILRFLFVQTGPRCFQEEWEIEVGLLSLNRCTRYRYPLWANYVWYLLVAFCVAGMSVFIIAVALMFDENEYFVCSGGAAENWVATFCASLAISLFVVEPLKITLFVYIQHATGVQERRYARARSTIALQKTQSVLAIQKSESKLPYTSVENTTPPGSARTITTQKSQLALQKSESRHPYTNMDNTLPSGGRPTITSQKSNMDNTLPAGGRPTITSQKSQPALTVQKSQSPLTIQKSLSESRLPSTSVENTTPPTSTDNTTTNVHTAS